MKRFKFRFEKILGFRRYREKEKQRELADVMHRRMHKQGEIDDLCRDRDQTQSGQRNMLVGKIRLHQLNDFTRYYLVLRQLELNGRQVLLGLDGEVSKKREELLEASREKKIYEKLKERYLEKHTAENNILMQKEMDEIGQKLHFQKS